VRLIQSYILLFLLVLNFAGHAQKQSLNTIPLSFPDSVRVVLENTKNTDATVIAAAFSSAWTALGTDHQSIIQKQVRLMKQRKVALRPNIVNYLGAIANAVSIEHADPSKITQFLNVTQKVIENENGGRLQQFFKSSRTFFQFHALYYDRGYRLYARDDNYTFDYIEPAAGFDLGSSDPGPAPEPDAPVNETAPPPEVISDPAAEEAPAQDFFAEAPLWMNPPPPPVIEGPVIRFDRITLNFVTKFDSVFLKNSKGVYSLRDYTFSGEKGTFDFTPAGIPADVVDCEITVYNLKVNKPEFRSDLAKLNYKDKTPGYIPGVFEFKSVARKDSAFSTYPRFKSFQSSLEIQGIGDKNLKYTGGFSLIGNKISGASVGGEDSKVEIFNQGQKKFIATSREFLFSEGMVLSNKANCQFERIKEA
jgi:hypothetical protein